MFVSWKFSLLCFYNYVIFFTTRSEIWVFSQNTEDLQFCPLPELISTLTVQPIFCCNLHLVKRVEGENGKLWPRIQSSPWMRWDAISYLTPQWVWSRINGQGMVWNSANWKAITSTGEKSSWILHWMLKKFWFKLRLQNDKDVTLKRKGKTIKITTLEIWNLHI